MKKKLIKNFILTYPYLFTEDQWFWEEKLSDLLDIYYNSKTRIYCPMCSENIEPIPIECLCPVCRTLL